MPKNKEVNLNFAIGLPPEKAIEYFKSKGYTFSWDWTDVWKDAHAKAFTVAKVIRMDILQDIRVMVQKAIDEGITFSQFQKELEPRLKAKGWWGKVLVGDGQGGQVVQLGSPWRLKTIYDTNIQTAYMAGRYREMMNNVDNRPYWQYLAVMDGRTRPAHSRLNGKVFRYDDPIWDKIYPPNGFRCRCRVRALSEDNMKEKSLSVSPSQNIPNISDPGWDYNPGKASFEPDLKKYDKKIADLYDKMPKKPRETKKATKAEPSKPQGIAEKIKVKNYEDVQNVMKTYASENPDIFKKGYKELKYTNNSYFMATDCQGTIYISKKPFKLKNFNPGRDLKNALAKIGKGQPLSFQEEYSLESLWHEIMHNRVEAHAFLRKGSSDHIAMETLNQFVSRHTYADFIKQLGGTAAHQKDVIENGYGYNGYVNNFRTFLNKIGIDEAKEIGNFQNILLDNYRTLHYKLSSHISSISKKDLKTVQEALNSLYMDKTKYEAKLVDLGI